MLKVILKNKTKIFFVFVILLSSIFTIKHFYNKKITKKNNYNNIQKVLQIATSPDFPPFEFMQRGKIVGIDVDIVKAISKETGIHFEWNNMSFGTIIAGLTSKKVDIAISGINATPERRQNVDFTDAYVQANLALITKDDKREKTLQQLAGQKIGVQTGTTMQEYLINYNKNNLEHKRVNIEIIDDNSVGIEMLLSGKIDAFLTEELQGKVYVKMYDNLGFTEIKTKDGGYNIALQKNSPYTKIINNALIKLKKDGTIDKILEKWTNKYISQTIKQAKKQQYINSLFYIAKGSLITIQYSIVSIFCGLIIALFLSLLSYSGSKFLLCIAKIYISIIRGTPLLLQMSFVYFGLSKILGVNLSIFTSAVIALSFNSAAYVAEIIRSGVRSIDKGQFDACRSLNLTKFQAIKDVYIPQIVHNIFPALINEFIALIKESSIVSIFGGLEIMKRTNLVIAEYYSYFIPLAIAGLSYYIMTFTLEMLAYFYEKRYKY